MFSLCLFVLCAVLFKRSFSKNETIAIVFSYEPDATGEMRSESLKRYLTFFSQNSGIVNGLISEGFLEGVNINVVRLYMSTKTENKTPEKKEARAEEIRGILDQYSLSCLFTLDDDAFNYVGLHPKTSENVIYGGVNVQLETYNATRKYFFDSREKPGGNVSGVYEKNFVSSTLKIWGLALDMTKVLIILDNNTVSGRAIRIQIEKELEEFGSEIDVVTEIVSISYFYQLKDLILNRVNVEDDISAVYTMGLTLYGDSTRSKVHKMHKGDPALVDFISKNSQKPEFVNQPKFVSLGLFGGVGLDFVSMGFESGVMCGKVLNGGKIGNLPMQFNPKNLIYFNLDRLRTLESHGVKFQQNALKTIEGYANYIFKKKIVVHPRFDSTKFHLIITSITSSLVVVSCCSICLIILAFLIVYRVVKLHKKKIDKITTLVQYIVVLDLDNDFVEKIKSQNSHSRVEKILIKIIDNLKGYVAYLPQSIFAEEIKRRVNHKGKRKSREKYLTPEISKRVKQDIEEVVIRSPLLSPLTNIITIKNEDSDEDSSDEGSTMSWKSCNILSPIEKRRKKILLGLRIRNITVMLIEIADFTRVCKELPVDILEYVLEQVTDVIQKNVTDFGGTVNFIVGSKFFCSFNSATRCVDHGKQCCSSALKILEDFEKINDQWRERKANSFELQIVACTGVSNVGNIGSEKLKAFNIFGKCLDDVQEVIKENRNFGVKFLLKGALVDDIKFTFNFKLLKKVQKNEYLCEVIDKKIPGEPNEWMYVLEKLSESDRYVEYNEAFLFEENKKYVLAKKRIDSFLKKNPDDRHALSLRKSLVLSLRKVELGI